jgi:ribonuclease E
MEYPILSEGYSLTTSNRRDRREIIRPITETPEVVTVEMTSDEQDVYALMGISPLTLLEEGIVKSSKSIIISIRQPGEGENHLSSTTLKKEEVELESVVNDHESDDDDRELDDFNSSVSFDKGDDFDVGEEHYHYDLELSDSDVDLNSDSNDSDDSGPIRRRRRRSSAVTVED